MKDFVTLIYVKQTDVIKLYLKMYVKNATVSELIVIFLSKFVTTILRSTTLLFEIFFKVTEKSAIK